MCTYNGTRFLQEQLDSIAAQTRPPDELVVCDDCSTDETREIIERFASVASFPVRLYVNDKNLGSTKNFEKAIALCRGDIIALSDQDDIWHQEKLALMGNSFSVNDRTGLVFTDAELVDENLNPLNLRMWQLIFQPSELRRVRKGQALNVFLNKQFTITGATLAFRSGLRKYILPIPTETFLIHDGWIGLALAAVTEVMPIDQPLIKYRQHTGQQTGALLKAYEKPDLARKHFFRQQEVDYLREIHIHARVLRQVEETAPLEGRSRAQAIESKIAYLKGAAAHTSARACLNATPGRLNRIPAIARELLTLRYHRYGRGLRSAARDLISA